MARTKQSHPYLRTYRVDRRGRKHYYEVPSIKRNRKPLAIANTQEYFGNIFNPQPTAAAAAAAPTEKTRKPSALAKTREYFGISNRPRTIAAPTEDLPTYTDKELLQFEPLFEEVPRRPHPRKQPRKVPSKASVYGVADSPGSGSNSPSNKSRKSSSRKSSSRKSSSHKSSSRKSSTRRSSVVQVAPLAARKELAGKKKRETIAKTKAFLEYLKES